MSQKDTYIDPTPTVAPTPEPQFVCQNENCGAPIPMAAFLRQMEKLRNGQPVECDTCCTRS